MLLVTVITYAILDYTTLSQARLSYTKPYSTLSINEHIWAHMRAAKSWLFQLAAKLGQAEVYAGPMNKEAWACQSSRSGTHPSPRTIWNNLELTWANREMALPWHIWHASIAMSCRIRLVQNAFQVSSSDQIIDTPSAKISIDSIDISRGGHQWLFFFSWHARSYFV